MERSSLIQRWFGAAGGAEADPAPVSATSVTQPDLRAIRAAMTLAMGPCTERHRLRAAVRIELATSAVELWLLRADIFQYLAQDLGQQIAAQEITRLPCSRAWCRALQRFMKVLTIGRMSDTCIDNYRFLARYNRWMNQRLYEACESLTDEERKQKRGAFFGSIHHTLTHLVLGDKMWLHRFATQETAFAALSPALLALPQGSDYTSDMHPDWHDLRQTRDALDEVIEQWLDGMAADFLTSTLRYANTKGVQRAHPAWQAMTHFFNHQTHHRGQATTLLMQAGVDPGVTDLIALV